MSDEMTPASDDGKGFVSDGCWAGGLGRQRINFHMAFIGKLPHHHDATCELVSRVPAVLPMA